MGKTNRRPAALILSKLFISAVIIKGSNFKLGFWRIHL
jgi:hypothetical protein